MFFFPTKSISCWFLAFPTQSNFLDRLAHWLVVLWISSPTSSKCKSYFNAPMIITSFRMPGVLFKAPNNFFFFYFWVESHRRCCELDLVFQTPIFNPYSLCIIETDFFFLSPDSVNSGFTFNACPYFFPPFHSCSAMPTNRLSMGGDSELLQLFISFCSLLEQDVSSFPICYRWRSLNCFSRLPSTLI